MANLINGRQYEWADLTLMLGGKMISGFRGITYTESQEKEALYGKGNKPLSIQRGNITYEGEIVLTQDELETLKTVGGGSVLGLVLDAVVCYGDATKGDVVIVDRIFGLQFTEDSKSLSQGDKFMEITLPFVCTEIKYQG